MTEAQLQVPPTAPRLATSVDAPVVTRILVEAFRDDPMWGPWAFPDPATRRQHRETVFRLLVAGALRYTHVWLTAAETATAVWIPPGGTEMSAEQEARVDDLLRESLGDRAAAVLHAFEQFETARPAEPHFYLTLLGTDPNHAGERHGRRLLESNLRRVDGEQAPAYLEAGDEVVAFYERYGFRVLTRFEVREGPTVNAMWRDPRPLRGLRSPEWIG
jgi:ribosomal protein S18 acetylase RimI-like enzyme